MSIIDQFSSSLNRKDQGPNRELARRIAKSSDHEALNEVTRVLKSDCSQKIKNDAILTLALLSELAPDLVKPKLPDLLPLLQSRSNRVVFGTMITLSNIAFRCIDELWEHLPLVLSAMSTSTVVTKDHGFRILLVCYANEKFKADAFPLILEQIHMAPDNQLGQYGEKFAEVADRTALAPLRDALLDRLPELHHPGHQRRISKLLRKVNRQL